MSSNMTEGDRPVFDHEKLDVYRLELQFITWATDLIQEVKASAGPLVTDICGQLDRSSLSSLLNTAEGNGRRQMLQRARFFDDARGSGMESAACLDALVAKRACGAGRVKDGKELLRRIVGMLTKLVTRFSSDSGAREEATVYSDGDQDKQDGEAASSSSEVVCPRCGRRPAD